MAIELSIQHVYNWFFFTPLQVDMGVSKNRGTPKSSILIGFSIINHPFWVRYLVQKHPMLLDHALFLDELGTTRSCVANGRIWRPGVREGVHNLHQVRWGAEPETPTLPQVLHYNAFSCKGHCAFMGQFFGINGQSDCCGGIGCTHHALHLDQN